MGLTLNKGRLDKIDKKGVFSAGDLLTGPTSVIDAIKTAREAAAAIDKYLGGNGIILVQDKVMDPEFVYRMSTDEQKKAPACGESPCMKPGERTGNFKEVELGLSEKIAKEEAKRCWRCDWTEC
jgi:hypothetical protein